MGHITGKSEYLALQRRLDKIPVGAPAHRELFALLEELYTAEECRVAAAMPMRLATAEKIAECAGMEPRLTRAILDNLAEKGLVIDLHSPKGKTYFHLNPTVIGFFEFTMMRVRTEINQKKAAHHLWNYIAGDPEHAFMRMVMEGETFLARPLVHEGALTADTYAEVLDYEKASVIIDQAGQWAEAMCHCRHVKMHLDQPCAKPQNMCLSFGQGAQYLTRHGMAQPIDKARALEVVSLARELDMVMTCDNIKQQPLFICTCCKCCCEIMEGLRTLPRPQQLISSNYVATFDEQICNGCGKCAVACPVEAIKMEPAQPTPQAKKRKQRATVDPHQCLGCGVCQRHCRFDALALKPIGERVFTPETTMHKVVLQAIERGKLQYLIFDNQTQLSHRTLGAIMAAILKLPPAKQLLARRQIRSKFVDVMLDGFWRTNSGKAAKK